MLRFNRAHRRQPADRGTADWRRFGTAQAGALLPACRVRTMHQHGAQRSPPDPASESSESSEGGAAAAPSSPLFTTPVIVALLSLSGVLGASLITNWDKLFGGRHVKTAAAASATAASAPGTAAPDLQRLQGVWLSPVSLHPYQPDRHFRLRIVLTIFGDEVTGSVSDEPVGGSGGPAFEILSPKLIGEGLDFQVSSTWCCEDGKEKPYQIFYQLRPTSQGLAVSRRNNAPGGGKVERFLLERSG